MYGVYLIVFSLYVLYLPVVQLVFGSIFSDPYYIAFVIAIMVAGILPCFIRRTNVLLFKDENSDLSIMLLAIGIIVLTFYYISLADLSTLFNRQNRNLPEFNNQYFIIYNLLVQGFFFSVFASFRSLVKSTKIISLILLAIYAILEIAFLGGRKYTIAIFLCAAYHLGFLEYILARWYRISILYLAIIIGLFFGIFRELVFHGVELSYLDVTDYKESIDVALFSNEFSEIGVGLVESVLFSETNGYFYGATYLNILYYLVPRMLWDSKPLSVTSEFGFAASPFSEAYLNFGMFGFVPIIIYCMAIWYIYNRSRSLYSRGLCAGLTFELCRTDLAGLLYSLIVYKIVFFLTKKRRLKN